MVRPRSRISLNQELGQDSVPSKQRRIPQNLPPPPLKSPPPPPKQSGVLFLLDDVLRQNPFWKRETPEVFSAAKNRHMGMCPRLGSPYPLPLRPPPQPPNPNPHPQPPRPPRPPQPPNKRPLRLWDEGLALGQGSVVVGRAPWPVTAVLRPAASQPARGPGLDLRTFGGRRGMCGLVLGVLMPTCFLLVVFLFFFSPFFNTRVCGLYCLWCFVVSFHLVRLNVFLCLLCCDVMVCLCLSRIMLCRLVVRGFLLVSAKNVYNCFVRP